MNGHKNEIAGGIVGLLSVGSAWFVTWYTGLAWQYQLLGVLIALDTAAGVLLAIRDWRFEFKKMREGITQKMMYVLIVTAIAAAGEQAELAAGEAAALTFAAVELTSILKTAAHFDIIVPPSLQGLADRLKTPPQRRIGD